MTLRIDEVLWRDDVVDKLGSKHGIEPDEVEQVLLGSSRFYRVERGHLPNESLYAAYGQTEAGRYVVVFFVLKLDYQALVVSARNMSPRERQKHARK